MEGLFFWLYTNNNGRGTINQRRCHLSIGGNIVSSLTLTQTMPSEANL